MKCSVLSVAIVALATLPCAAQQVSAPVGPARISGGVMAGQILSSTPPTYPPIAKAAHVSGSVVLHAVISREGTVEKLETVAGPAMLRAAAVDAVRQWVYKPYLLNGKPTEVDTVITVNFNIAPPPGQDPAGSGDMTNAPSVSAPVVELPADSPFLKGATKVPPRYPAEAKQKHITGDVQVDVLIGTNGKVELAAAADGPAELREAAVDAVEQWVYAPYAEGGEPRKVKTQVTIHFRMSN